jgi:hypothetical protein
MTVDFTSVDQLHSFIVSCSNQYATHKDFPLRLTIVGFRMLSLLSAEDSFWNSDHCLKLSFPFLEKYSLPSIVLNDFNSRN